MNRVTCSACNQDVVPSPPDPSYWALIVSFWVFSFLFGLGVAMGISWGFMLFVGWLILATTTGVVVQHATSWTCPECAAAITPPDSAFAPGGTHAHA